MVRVYQLGEKENDGHWYVRDFEESEHSTACRYAICTPAGTVVAWTDYEDDALRIAETMDEAQQQRVAAILRDAGLSQE